jgi:predicted secreted protein
MKNMENEDLKGAVSWVAKIAKQGDARIITVPKNYWENNIIDENKVYKIWAVPIADRDDSD